MNPAIVQWDARTIATEVDDHLDRGTIIPLVVTGAFSHDATVRACTALLSSTQPTADVRTIDRDDYGDTDAFIAAMSCTMYAMPSAGTHVLFVLDMLGDSIPDALDARFTKDGPIPTHISVVVLTRANKKTLLDRIGTDTLDPQFFVQP